MCTVYYIYPGFDTFWYFFTEYHLISYWSTSVTHPWRFFRLTFIISTQTWEVSHHLFFPHTDFYLHLRHLKTPDPPLGDDLYKAWSFTSFSGNTPEITVFDSRATRWPKAWRLWVRECNFACFSDRFWQQRNISHGFKLPSWIIK